jgi:heptaprenyl diphosphate synthase
MKNIPVTTATRIAMWASFALILFLFEALAPRILPWMKLGLGNLVTLLVLMAYGFPAALLVAVVKLIVGGLVTGTLAGPAFVIGGGAGLLSLTAMAAARRLVIFSVVGLSILGAVTHQLSQLMLATAVLGIEGLTHLIPLFLSWGLISGGIVGLIVYWVVEKLRSVGVLESLS